MSYPVQHTLVTSGPIFGNQLRIIWSCSGEEGAGIIWSDYSIPQSQILEVAWQMGQVSTRMLESPELTFFLHPALLEVNNSTGATKRLRRTLILAEGPVARLNTNMGILRLVESDSPTHDGGSSSDMSESAEY